MTFYLIVTIIVSIVSVVLILAVLFQESKSYGLSSSIAGGASNFWGGGTKARTKQGKLAKITIIAGIVFFIAAILLNVGLFTNL